MNSYEFFLTKYSDLITHRHLPFRWMAVMPGFLGHYSSSDFYRQVGRIACSDTLHCQYSLFQSLASFFLCTQQLFLSGYSIMLRDGLLSFNGLIISTGWALAAYPLLHIIALFVPFKFQKNVNFIRWRFLLPLYRRQGLLPPRLPFWLPPERP